MIRLDWKGVLAILALVAALAAGVGLYLWGRSDAWDAIREMDEEASDAAADERRRAADCRGAGGEWVYRSGRAGYCRGAP